MHDILLWLSPSETQLNALTKSGLLRGTLSASEQLALISGTDKIEEACRDAKHVQVKSLPIETVFKCSLNAVFWSLWFEVKNWKFARGGGDRDIVLNASSLQKERLKWNQLKACVRKGSNLRHAIWF